jgi:anaerobic selenocysteine-containing dehydrogenase
VKVEGSLLNPISQGGICPLGAASVQYLYEEKIRVKKPLKRVGNRGEGKWQEISWSEAIDLLTNKLKELKSSGATEGLLCVDGSVSGVMAGLLKKFCLAYGTSNYVHLNQDAGTALAIKAMQGHIGTVGFDLENADYVLSFGSQILEGWGTPVKLQATYAYWHEDRLKPKAKLVQIEPRMSDTAVKADEWLPVVPGSEALLALGMAYVILKEGLYNNRFANDVDFENFKRLVLRNYSPANVAEKTGIAKEDIVRIAREFAKAKRPVAVWGRGKGYNATGVYEVMAIHALNALVGNINRKGGVVFFKDITEEIWPEVANVELKDLATFAEAVANKNAYAEMALICEANPVYKLPTVFGEALKNISFVVTFTPFLNDTALQSDLVLPTPFYLERWEGVTTPRGFVYPMFGLSQPARKPLYDTQHPGDVILKVAQSVGLGQELPWRNYKKLLQDFVEKLYAKGEGKLVKGNQTFPLPSGPRAMWNQLTTCVWVNPEAVKKGIKEFDFVPAVLAEIKTQLGWEIKGNDKDYPFALIPCEHFILAEDMGSAPYLIKQLPDTVLKGNDLCVEVHPETAAKLGFKDGDYAYLQTPFGKEKVKVYCYDCIRPGVIAIPVGLGHKGYDEYLAGKGINAYALLGYAKEATGITSCVLGKANLTKI